MEHGFPPGANWASIRTETVVAHVAMLLLVLGSIGGLFLTRRRVASSADVWTWAAVICATPIAALIVRQGLDRFARESSGPFISGYILFVWLICLTGMIRSHRSIKRQQKSSPLGCSIVCLAGLGIFIMLSLPAVPHAREAARRIQCMSHLKQIGVALHNYMDTYDSFPLAVDGNHAVSWRVRTLPFFDQQKLFEKYDQNRTWDSDQNEPLAKIRIPGLQCPSRREPPNGINEQGYAFTDYTMLTGPETFSGEFKPRTPQGIMDGASNTLAVVEAAGLNIVWTEPRDAQIDREPLGINFKGTGRYDSPGLLSSWHVGGANAVFADGSTRFLNQNIAPAVLKALTTVNGGESLPEQY